MTDLWAGMCLPLQMLSFLVNVAKSHVLTLYCSRDANYNWDLFTNTVVTVPYMIVLLDIAFLHANNNFHCPLWLMLSNCR